MITFLGWKKTSVRYAIITRNLFEIFMINHCVLLNLILFETLKHNCVLKAILKEVFSNNHFIKTYKYFSIIFWFVIVNVFKDIISIIWILNEYIHVFKMFLKTSTLCADKFCQWHFPHWPNSAIYLFFIRMARNLRVFTIVCYSAFTYNLIKIIHFPIIIKYCKYAVWRKNLPKKANTNMDLFHKLVNSLLINDYLFASSFLYLFFDKLTSFYIH